MLSFMRLALIMVSLHCSRTLTRTAYKTATGTWKFSPTIQTIGGMYPLSSGFALIYHGCFAALCDVIWSLILTGTFSMVL